MLSLTRPVRSIAASFKKLGRLSQARGSRDAVRCGEHGDSQFLRWHLTHRSSSDRYVV